MTSNLSAARDIAALEAIAKAPFAAADELFAFGAAGQREATDSLNRLKNQGCVNCIQHRRTIRPLRRWYLTERGASELARRAGFSGARLLQRHPISAEWQRSLLRRLDTVDLFYRIALQASRTHGSPIEWRWYRTGALDAALRLPDGRAFALMRFGSTLSWLATKSRLGSLHNLQNRHRCPPALLLLPGDIEAQRIAQFTRRRAIALYMASEDRLYLADDDSAAIWRPRREERRLTLAQAFADSRPRRTMPEAERHPNDSPPYADIKKQFASTDMLSSQLQAQGKDILRLLHDFPLMRNADLARILGISEGTLKRPRSSLIRQGLVHQIWIGDSRKEQYAIGARLALSDMGLAWLARADRRRLSDLTRHWRVAPSAEGHPELSILDYRLEGTKLRTLARELTHTDAVSEFTAMLIDQARSHANYQFVQATPPHKWSRRFNFNARRSLIYPDAVFALDYRGERRHYFLEYEERATAPSLMRRKLPPYQKYYGSAETRRDFDGGRPTCLFVYATAAAAARFSVFVSREAARERPLLVSSMDVLRERGVFGYAWQNPWRLERGRQPLDATRR